MVSGGVYAADGYTVTLALLKITTLLSSHIFPTEASEFVKVGMMCPSPASLENWLPSACAVPCDCVVLPSGKVTLIPGVLVRCCSCCASFGVRNVSVAPESRMAMGRGLSRRAIALAMLGWGRLGKSELKNVFL